MRSKYVVVVVALCLLAGLAQGKMQSNRFQISGQIRGLEAGVFTSGRFEIDSFEFLPGQVDQAPKGLVADLDQDGSILFSDFLVFVQAFADQHSIADLSQDGQVNFDDFILFVQAFGSKRSAKRAQFFAPSILKRDNRIVVTSDGQPFDIAVLAFRYDVDQVQPVFVNAGTEVIRMHDGVLFYRPEGDQHIEVAFDAQDPNVQLDLVGGLVWNEGQLDAVRGSQITFQTKAPSEFALKHPYPNPFNPATTIAFSVPVQAEVKLAVFNIMGQLIRTVSHDRYASGHYYIRWDGRDDLGQEVASGVYLIRLAAPDFSAVQRVTLMK